MTLKIDLNAGFKICRSNVATSQASHCCILLAWPRESLLLIIKTSQNANQPGFEFEKKLSNGIIFLSLVTFG
jgi:hypothetical protein